MPLLATDPPTRSASSGAALEGRRVEVRGTVQGVGFRPFVWREASALGLAGRVRNDASGVVVEAFGPRELLDALVERIRLSPPPAAAVREVRCRPIPAEPADGFAIVPSSAGAEREVSIPPDLAVCADCLREVFDPADRRFGYAFTNCTSCGPRFTLATGAPYDRAATTMAGFAMCDACRREYGDPSSRRFHAQPNACPACGPRLAWLDATGLPLPGAPIAQAAEALREGRVVAVKGLGGYHLACDAASEAAVARLRARKRRGEKPFAVMVRTLAEAEALLELGEAERGLLGSVERPIVLAPRRAGARVAGAVAPGVARLGVMLAYTPLHHLLLAAFGGPLVMTSGNLSDEPIAADDADALARLGDVADAFLAHDRPIATRCDDAVAQVVAGGPMVLRRSRGFVPRAVTLAQPVRRPVLAVGAHLKNAACLAFGDTAFLGPHVGDLETVDAYEALAGAVAKLERFLGVKPELVAHDLHPDYLSTRYALTRPEPKVAVQHHHAHVAAAMAEHGLAGPVLGVAFDGTGLGADGVAWGGELLVADARGFERVATLRPIPLAGGEAAVREPWRVALALLDDAFAGNSPLDRFPLFAKVPPGDVAVVRRLIARRVNAPDAHGVGRLFDGVASLALARPRAAYEAQLATAWMDAAWRDEPERYAIDLDRRRTPWQLDPRPLVRAIADDVVDEVPAGAMAGAFHRALAEATAAAVRAALDERGPLPVVLCGGCFQNRLFAEGVLAALRGLDVRLPRAVPPGDGGLALGQAIVAAAKEE